MIKYNINKEIKDVSMDEILDIYLKELNLKL